MMIHICISFSGSKVYLSTWLVYLCKCTLFNFAKRKENSSKRPAVDNAEGSKFIFNRASAVISMRFLN